MLVKYFKNGNINIKLEKDEIQAIHENVNRYNTTVFMATFELLMNSTLDFIMADECEGCAGNYTTYYALYNCYTGYEYTPLYEDITNAAAGKTLKLYARKITENELKEQYNEYYGG